MPVGGGVIFTKSTSSNANSGMSLLKAHHHHHNHHHNRRLKTHNNFGTGYFNETNHENNKIKENCDIPIDDGTINDLINDQDIIIDDHESTFQHNLNVSSNNLRNRIIIANNNNNDIDINYTTTNNNNDTNNIIINHNNNNNNTNANNNIINNLNVNSTSRSKKLFPQKLWDLINDDKYNFCLRWSEDGQLVYLNRDEFEEYYLKTNENQFHTQKAISFVRQMNMYGFRKVDDFYYENDNFKRDKEYLLKNMIRKHPNKNGSLINGTTFQNSPVTATQTPTTLSPTMTPITTNLATTRDRFGSLAGNEERALSSLLVRDSEPILNGSDTSAPVSLLAPFHRAPPNVNAVNQGIEQVHGHHIEDHYNNSHDSNVNQAHYDALTDQEGDNNHQALNSISYPIVDRDCASVYEMILFILIYAKLASVQA